MNMNRLQATRQQQRGATLLVAMIFLVVLMLIVASAIKVTNVNTKLVGNMQIQKEADAAARVAVEQIISTDFALQPGPRTITVDINNSGQAGSTFSVEIPKPECLQKRPIRLSELDLANPDDQACGGGSIRMGGVSGDGNSVCEATTWDVRAIVTPPNSDKATLQIHQGVSQRVDQNANC